jgi:hypothetical protein
LERGEKMEVKWRKKRIEKNGERMRKLTFHVSAQVFQIFARIYKFSGFFTFALFPG